MHPSTLFIVLVAKAVTAITIQVDDGAFPSKTKQVASTATEPFSSSETTPPTTTSSTTTRVPKLKTTTNLIDGPCQPPACEQMGCHYSNCSYYCAVCLGRPAGPAAGPAATYETPAPEKK